MSSDPSFRMTVQDVFSIRDRGTVVTGQIESGQVSVGDEISIERPGYTKRAIVAGLEAFRKQLSQAGAGADVGLLLRDIGKQDVQRGDVLVGVDTEFSWKA